MPDLLVEIIEVIVIAAVSIFAGEYVRRAVRKIALRAGATTEVASAIQDAVRIVWLVSMISIILFVTGFPSGGLTIGAIGGLALSLALQSTLSNILAGLLFFYDNTLRIHDQVLYSGIRGTVIRISLRNTWIRDVNGDVTIVSNNTLQNGPFTNYTAKERLNRKLYPE